MININNDIQSELSKCSRFLTQKLNKSNNILWKQDTIKTDQIMLIDKLVEVCVKHSNIVETEDITISSEHQKNTYLNLNSFFQPILDEVNIDFVAVFCDDNTSDLLRCYFQFYKKFNNIKIEYKFSKENYIMIYDNRPICLIVENISSFTEATLTTISTLKVHVEYQYCNELHNAIRFNLIDNPLKVERKLKIEKLSKKSS